MDAETIALIKGLSGGGSSLPAGTASDRGKVLKAEIGETGDVSWRPNSPSFCTLPFTYNGTGNTIFYHGSDLPDDDMLQVISNEGGFTLELKESGTYNDIVSCFARLISYPSGVSDKWYFATGMLDFGGMGTACALVEIDNTSKYVTGRFFFPANQMNRFVVTLTPTALDYSGTMDKTANEITAAYEAGQEIVFNVVGFPGFDHVYIPAAWCSYATDNPICAACATLVDANNDLQIIIVTSDVDGGTAYYTAIYSLTPAS